MSPKEEICCSVKGAWVCSQSKDEGVFSRKGQLDVKEIEHERGETQGWKMIS